MLLRKFCPLQSLEGDTLPCAGPSCAWWDNEHACCAMVSVSNRLVTLTNAISEVALP